MTVEIVRELSLVDARQSGDASEGKDLAVKDEERRHIVAKREV